MNTNWTEPEAFDTEHEDEQAVFAQEAQAEADSMAEAQADWSDLFDWDGWSEGQD